VLLARHSSTTRSVKKGRILVEECSKKKKKTPRRRKFLCARAVRAGRDSLLVRHDCDGWSRAACPEVVEQCSRATRCAARDAAIAAIHARAARFL
jgi:hypothetical protein